MKNNQKGFGVVEALVIIVIVGLIGFGGWFMWHSNQKDSKDEKTVSSTQKSQNDTTDNSKEASGTTYTDDTAGISFYVPDGWKVTPKDRTGNDIVRLTVTSSDYTPDEDSAYGGSKTGSQVTIAVRDLSVSSYIIPVTSKILSGNTQESKESYSEAKAVKVANVDGVSYKVGYEGPKRLVNQFEHANKQYLIELQEDLDGPTFNANIKTYQKIVDSFKLKK